MKYSDLMVKWLKEEGYTHCFFVAGGNIMHLLNSVRIEMTCIPFVNEVGGAIAVEAFNEMTSIKSGKAFLLVTAGPGLTNAVTGISGAWLESRELLVIGGQVKSSDLKSSGLRQRGIQEIDGVTLVSSITKKSIRITTPIPRKDFIETVRQGYTGRKGPVFIEVCLDAQAVVQMEMENTPCDLPATKTLAEKLDERVVSLIDHATRPILLIGGGVPFDFTRSHLEQLTRLGIPIMTTWNGADRVPESHSHYFGRPNTWGQRAANLIIQQADLVIAVGTRLGLQQTGFAWEEFLPNGKIVHIDIDKNELEKGHPVTEVRLNLDSKQFLLGLFEHYQNVELNFRPWLEFAKSSRDLISLNDHPNKTNAGYVDPYVFGTSLTDQFEKDAIIVPCSSGSSFTVLMQTVILNNYQRMISSKGLASMGYGLSTAIGCSLANPAVDVVLVEGDGGFAQNLQELGTVIANNLPIKIFVWANNGYASIRMTQRNYFDGSWVGCDSETGLGLPNLELLANTYNIPYIRMDEDIFTIQLLENLANISGPVIIEVPIDPEQTFYPKIMSAVQPDGSMKSNPLHLMSPDLPSDVAEKVIRYL